MEIKSNQQKKSYNLISLCIKWLKLIAIIHIIGGLCLSFNWPDFLWFEYLKQLYLNFNISSINNHQVDLMVSMLASLLGPTIASWGILMFFCVSKITMKNEHDIGFLTIATLVWFCLDTTISLKAGMNIHAVVNSLMLLAILIPLLMIKLNRMNLK